MTDNEIIKANELCAKIPTVCEECPYYGSGNCVNSMTEDTINLINRQKAEIERLEKTQVQYVKAYFDEFVERLKKDFSLAHYDNGLVIAIVDELVETMKNEFNTLDDFTDLIKAEAVKEFAERLCDDRVSNDPVVIAVKAELKEMVGDNNAE